MTSANADLLNFSAHARVLLGLTAIVWLVHAININGWLNRAFGLRPRNLWGLVGILFCPFLHSGARHLTGNTSFFLPLAWFILLQGIHIFYVVTIGAALLGGLLTWLLGVKKGPYVGASGVISGYMGFLFVYGLVAGSGIALLLAILSMVFYGKFITGYTYDYKGRTVEAASSLLPMSNPRTAWDGHLFGFVSGVLIALLLSDMRLS
ncbi:rhomboid family intramembrane serine protease [Phormidium tenue FACHB-886]|nr:rhomboid family intramembrane serine protease [Phormidium tenue FACHB-886]